MVASFIEALLSVQRIAKAYEAHQFAAGNIEYNHDDLPDGAIYSVKGTSPNPGGEGLIALGQDIISDIRFLPKRSPELGSFHPRGFLKAGRRLAYAIMRSGISNKKPIQLEGHSLGGAAALIAGATLVRCGYNVVRITTFGAPRVGKLPDLARTEVTMFKNGMDVVTAVPFGFAHHTKLVRIGDGLRPICNHMLRSYELALIAEIESVVDARRAP